MDVSGCWNADLYGGHGDCSHQPVDFGRHGRGHILGEFGDAAARAADCGRPGYRHSDCADYGRGKCSYISGNRQRHTYGCDRRFAQRYADRESGFTDDYNCGVGDWNCRHAIQLSIDVDRWNGRDHMDRVVGFVDRHRAVAEQFGTTFGHADGGAIGIDSDLSGERFRHQPAADEDDDTAAKRVECADDYQRLDAADCHVERSV